MSLDSENIEKLKRLKEQLENESAEEGQSQSD